MVDNRQRGTARACFEGVRRIRHRRQESLFSTRPARVRYCGYRAALKIESPCRSAGTCSGAARGDADSKTAYCDVRPGLGSGAGPAIWVFFYPHRAPLRSSGIGLAQIEHRDLGVEADRRPGDERLFRLYAGAVERVARGEVVGAIEDDICVGKQRLQVVRLDAFLQRDDVHIGIQRRQGGARRVDFRRADAIRPVEDLALQVGEIDLVLDPDCVRYRTDFIPVVRAVC